MDTNQVIEIGTEPVTNTYFNNSDDVSTRYALAPVSNLYTISFHDAIKGTTFLVVTFLIIISNILCLAVLRRIPDTDIKDATRYFMTSLSAADLCVGIFTSFPAAVAAGINRWPFGSLLCFLNVLLGGMFFYTVFWSLLAVSVERYIAVSKPLHYHRILTPRRSRAIVVLIWVASFMYELSVCMSNDFYVYYDYPTDMCWTLSTTGNGLGIIVSICICMILPFIIILVLYSKILIIARRHATHIAALTIHTGANPAARVTKRDTKAAITFIIITAGFIAATAPAIITGFYEALVGVRLPESVQFLAQLLAISNSWWNSIIYFTRNKVFRNTAVDILRRCRRVNL